jgi:hypothetical protein
MRQKLQVRYFHRRVQRQKDCHFWGLEIIANVVNKKLVSNIKKQKVYVEN